MKKLIYVFFSVVLFAGSGFAQNIQSLPFENSAPVAISQENVLNLPRNIMTGQFNKGPEDPIGMYSFDGNIQPLVWNIPQLYNATTPFTMVNIAQRFTMPGNGGTLDSAYIFIRYLPLGEVALEAYRDTIMQSGNGKTLHWVNYYTNPVWARVDTARVNFLEYDSLTFTLVNFNGKTMPKHFHIAASPTTESGITSAFRIITDSKVGLAANMTIDNAKTTFLAVVNQQLSQYQMYGIFSSKDSLGATVTRNPNVYIVAFVTPDGSTKAERLTPIQEFTLHQNYPNPVVGNSSQTEISFELTNSGHTTLTVFDAMGRTVKVLTNEFMGIGSYSASFDTRGLAAGYYYYQLRSGRQLLTRSMLVVK